MHDFPKYLQRRAKKTGYVP